MGRANLGLKLEVTSNRLSPKYGQVSFQQSRIIKQYQSYSYKQFQASKVIVLTSCGKVCCESGHPELRRSLPSLFIP